MGLSKALAEKFGRAMLNHVLPPCGRYHAISAIERSLHCAWISRMLHIQDLTNRRDDTDAPAASTSVVPGLARAPLTIQLQEESGDSRMIDDRRFTVPLTSASGDALADALSSLRRENLKALHADLTVDPQAWNRYADALREALADRGMHILYVEP